MFWMLIQLTVMTNLVPMIMKVMMMPLLQNGIKIYSTICIDLDALISSVVLRPSQSPLAWPLSIWIKCGALIPILPRRRWTFSTQLLHRSDDPTLSRTFSTGDRMLRYKLIDQYFFMDNFFAHKKKGNSSRGYTCMQLFVTDKWFVHVIPMTKKSEVPMALKTFARDIGAPDTILFDAALEHISK